MTDRRINMPYGSSKGALDRIVLAAAGAFGAKGITAKGITANALDPAPVDDGWVTGGIN